MYERLYEQHSAKEEESKALHDGKGLTSDSQG
jgi:hypothetical protein